MRAFGMKREREEEVKEEEEEEEENDENERMWLCYDEDNARCISNFKLYTKYIYIYI
jgi:hypothetical protein